MLEIIKSRTFGTLFLCLGLVLQIITFVISGDSILSLVCGMAGVVSVVLCSEKRITMYAFGFIQLFTYVILCLQQNLYGEIIENIFYFVTMIIGVIGWAKNQEEGKVISRELSKGKILELVLWFITVSFGVGFILNLTNDTQPYLDAFSTVPAIMAQILMILRYREQWYFWLLVDILTGVLWLKADNWCMVSQYIFWILNCFYGLIIWKSQK